MTNVFKQMENAVEHFVDVAEQKLEHIVDAAEHKLEESIVKIEGFVEQEHSCTTK